MDIILIIMTASTPLLLAALGELVAERSGVLNLGVEGMMVMGAVMGFGVAFTTGNPWLGVIASILAGAAMSLFFGFLTLTLVSNQVATGLALTLLGLGLSGQIGEAFVGQPGVKLPVLAGIDPLIPFSVGLTAAVAMVFVQNPGRAHCPRRRQQPRVGPCARLQCHCRALSLRAVRRRLRRIGRGLHVAGLYPAMDREHDGRSGLDCPCHRGFCVLAAVAGAGRCLFIRRNPHPFFRRPNKRLGNTFAVLVFPAISRHHCCSRGHLRQPDDDEKEHTGLLGPAFRA